jgi:hypothetical protein
MVALFLKRFPLEAYFWVFGLTILFFVEPHPGHFSICPFYHLGFSFCPGCGLGTSISHLMHGDPLLSFQSHPLGGIALIILSYRIFQLIKTNHKSYGTNY